MHPSPKQSSQSAKKDKPNNKLRVPSNWGTMIGSLKEDLSSDEAVPRRRRAYTEMDDLLNNDIIQGGDEALDIVKQATNDKNGKAEETKDEALGDLKPPFRKASPMVLSGNDQTPNRRE